MIALTRGPQGIGAADPTCTMDGVSRRLDRRPNRIAVLSVHTSPLAQPGTGDAGGMNVYVLQTARSARPERYRGRDLHPGHLERPAGSGGGAGGLVRNVVAGPFEGLDKHDLPTQLCPFTAEVLRQEARHRPGYYDLVHSHYWLSGQVGWLARDRWRVPLVHTAHTLAAVKNAALADGDVTRTRDQRDRREAGDRRVRSAGRQHRRRSSPAGRAVRCAPRPHRCGAARRRPDSLHAR